jgi:four helix bundle protein
MARNNLEERLINFSVMILEIVGFLPDTPVGKHFGGQLIRSGTSPALNYGEAQSAESRRDFIHKIQIVLKELRETHIALKSIHKAALIINNPIVPAAIRESDELIAIFVTSTSTARKNKDKENKK